jgi:hypothetical protein
MKRPTRREFTWPDIAASILDDWSTLLKAAVCLILCVLVLAFVLGAVVVVALWISASSGITAGMAPAIASTGVSYLGGLVAYLWSRAKRRARG